MFRSLICDQLPDINTWCEIAGFQCESANSFLTYLRFVLSLPTQNSNNLSRMKRVLTLTLLLFSLPLFSQSPAWEWARTTGGPGMSYFYGVNYSPGGSIYLTGGYSASYITFGSDSLVLYGPQSGQNSAIFIAKLTPSGSVVWARGFGGMGHDIGQNIAFGHNENLYLTGVSSSSYILFGADTLFNLPGVGPPQDNGSQYVAKFDSAGTYQWSRIVGGLRYLGYGSCVKADHEGNVYVAGLFTAPYVVFGSDTLFNKGSENMYLVKYDTDGILLWARSAGGVLWDAPTSMDIDETGHVLITGPFGSPVVYFDSIMLFNPATIGMGLKRSVFLAKYDPDGNVVWVKAEGGPGMSFGRHVSYLPSGGSLITGEIYPPSALFGNTVLPAVGNNSAFIAQHDPSGNLQWADAFGGAFMEYGACITSDHQGNAFMAGRFHSHYLTIGNDTLHNMISGSSIFIAKYDVFGNPLWAKSVGGISHDLPWDICADDANGVYLAGYSTSPTLAFGTDTLHGNQQMGFIAKISETTGISAKSPVVSEIMIYPNPFAGHFTIELPGRQTEIFWRLYDLHGRVLKSGKITETTQIQPDDLPGGIYLLSLVYKGRTETRKLIRFK